MSEQKQFTQGHALLIGVGADLPNTVQDAQGVSSILIDKERCAYPSNQVWMLTEKDATRQQVLDKLDKLAATIGPDDTFLFYFSGHGHAANISALNMTEYYLMPYGYDDTDLPNTTISRPELLVRLNAIKSQKQLILFDCCHASGLDDLEPQAKSAGFTLQKSALPQSSIDELGRGSGRVIISSCKAHELSYAGRPYSQFTQALIEGFSGKETSKQNGIVTTTDLANYAAKTVPQYTRNRQHPVMHFSKADNFAVAYYAAGSNIPKSLPRSARRQSDSELENTPTGVAQTGSNNSQIAGNSNLVAGDHGVAVGGNVGGNIITGNDSRVINAKEYVASMEHNIFNQKGQTVHGDQSNVSGDVNTGGGAFIAGGVSASEFVGRDKNIHGDNVKGDKVMGDKVGGNQYKVGKVSGGKVAIGENARIDITNNPAPSEIINALQPIISAVQSAPAEQRVAASEKVEELKQEVAKGEQSQDAVFAGLIQDLADLVPNAIQAIGTAFGSPLLSALAGQATDFVLKRIGAKK